MHIEDPFDRIEYYLIRFTMLVFLVVHLVRMVSELLG